MIDNSSATQVKKGTYFAWKTHGTWKMKLKVGRNPVIIDWHNIHFVF